uniref:Protein obstructor-E-like n=1 Tax=Diabrotica virgifera virgifera TaxID=50390 RepID=A0A6P7G758_DIAVI
MMILSLLFLAVGVFADTQDCPNSATPTFLPDTSNCSIYYECIRGHQYQLICPPGLLFNVDTNYCDDAEYVDCNTKDPLCPTAQGTANVVYSEDCSKFYRCVDGKKQLKNCPENMYFNSKTSSCDYMDNVDCGSVPAPTIPTAGKLTAND